MPYSFSPDSFRYTHRERGAVALALIIYLRLIHLSVGTCLGQRNDQNVNILFGWARQYGNAGPGYYTIDVYGVQNYRQCSCNRLCIL